MGKWSIDEQVELVDHLANCAADVMDAVAVVLPRAGRGGITADQVKRLTHDWHDCHHEMAVVLLVTALVDLGCDAATVRAVRDRVLNGRDHWIVPE